MWDLFEFGDDGSPSAREAPDRFRLVDGPGDEVAGTGEPFLCGFGFFHHCVSFFLILSQNEDAIKIRGDGRVS